MFVCAVVPVKTLRDSKRRLSAVLNPHERRLLAVAMLEDVLAALKKSEVQETVVVSNDSVIHEVADKHGVVYLEAGQSGLNSAIEEATNWCVQNGADAVLVLPADIPFVSSRDINKMTKLGAEETSVVLSPSQDDGTNAMLLNPPNSIKMCFGPRSFARHIKEARSRKVEVKFYYSAEIALDIDSVEDLKQLYKAEKDASSKRVLRQIAEHSEKARSFLAAEPSA